MPHTSSEEVVDQEALAARRRELGNYLAKMRADPNRLPKRRVKKVPDNLAIFDLVDRAASKLTSEELDQVPHDGSINYKHYLYGHPKISE